MALGQHTPFLTEAYERILFDCNEQEVGAKYTQARVWTIISMVSSIMWSPPQAVCCVSSVARGPQRCTLVAAQVSAACAGPEAPEPVHAAGASIAV